MASTYLFGGRAVVGRPVPSKIRADHCRPATAFFDLAPGLCSISERCAVVVGHVEEGEREFALAVSRAGMILSAGDGADWVVAGKDAVDVLQGMLKGRAIRLVI